MAAIAQVREVTPPPEKTLDAYKTLMDVAWQFDYTSEITKLEDLYKRAKQNQWNVDVDIQNWDMEMDPSKPIIATEYDTYMKMPFFQKLSQTQRETFAAHSAGQRLSQFLHGEQGAVLTAATVCLGIPDEQGRLYSATQAMDEARHVEVYDRYTRKLGIRYPINEGLKALIDTALKSEDWRKVMIAMNMIIEGLALGAFNNMYRSTNCPLLKEITLNVMRDESRHVSFGHAYLGYHVPRMHADDREELAQFCFDAISLMVRRLTPIETTSVEKLPQSFKDVLDVSGIEPEDYVKGITEAAELGIKQEMPPGHIHALKDLMMPAMVRSGLITKRTRALFEEAGVHVNEDLRILEAMEGGKSDQAVTTSILEETGVTY